MARTGRFGRLPTQAPDLSSQIVSMMEQWQAAEDRNILDAWTNGGRYNGQKVNDKDILNYYRKRRNAYDRDDPEYTEWDNDLWQLRFQISNEGVMMRYKNGRIGASAVAQHYRNWANRMPKNSSYYRNMMATAGDFAKIAKAQSAAASSAFDYEAMMQRINALDREIAATETFYGGLSSYAVAKGFLLPGESITDPNALNVFEARDLQALLDSHVSTDPDWPDIKEGIRQIYPDFKGPITWDRIKSMDDVAIAARRRKIQEYRKAPYDMSSYIRSEQQAIRDVRRTTLFARQLDIESDLATAYDIWSGAGSLDMNQRQGEEGRAGAMDPLDFVSGDPGFLKDLERNRQRLNRAGLLQEAAYVQAIIWAVQGTEESVQNLTTFQGASGMFGGVFETEGSLLSLGQENLAANNALQLVETGDAVIRFIPPPTSVQSALNEPWRMKFEVEELPINPETGLRGVTDRSQAVIAHRMDNGKWVGSIYAGKPVVGFNNEVLGYVWSIGGRKMYGGPDPAIPGAYKYVLHNPWENPEFGQTLVDRGEQFQVMVDAAQMEAMGSGGFSPNYGFDPSEAVQSLLEKLGPITPQEREEVIANIQPTLDAAAQGDWQAIMSDPQKRQAWMEAYEGDFQQMAYWSDKGEAEEVMLRESLRNRLNAPIEFTTQDAMYVKPEGGIRSYDDARALGLYDAAGMPNDAALQEQVRFRVEDAAQPVVSPTVTVAENDPAYQNALANGDMDAVVKWFSDQSFNDMGTNNPSLTWWSVHPEELKGDAGDTADFWTVVGQGHTNQTDIDASADDISAWYTLSPLVSIFDGLKKTGASADTIHAGSVFGVSQAYADRQRDVTGLGRSTGYEPYTTPTEPEIGATIFRSAKQPWQLDPIRSDEPRADQILPIAMADRQPVLGPPAPNIAMAGNLQSMAGGAPAVAQSVNIKQANITPPPPPAAPPPMAQVNPIRLSPLSAPPPAQLRGLPRVNTTMPGAVPGAAYTPYMGTGTGSTSSVAGSAGP